MKNQGSEFVEVQCANLTPQQKALYNEHFKQIKMLLGKVREIHAPWSDMPLEKQLGVYQENEHLIQLDKEMCEDFQLCLNPQQTGIDAVGIAHTVQLKVLGGITENSKMFKLSNGKKICDYVEEMKRVSGDKKALFSFFNKKEKKIQVFDSEMVKDIKTSYLKWDNKTCPIREMGFSLDCVDGVTSSEMN